MSAAIQKVKEVLHVNKDKNASTTHTHNTSTHTGNNVPEGTAGPHNTRVANAADPRVDSDLDSTGRHTGTTGHVGTGTVGTGAVGTGHNTHTGHSTTTSTTTPHSSNLLNKADPRVDTSTTHSNSAYTTGSTTGSLGHSTTANTNTTTGPHNSNLLNKVDPRVDSDMDGSRNMGAATGNTGASAYTSNTGTHGTTGNYTPGTTSGISNSTNNGPHNSNMANKADPRVDSDLDGRGNRLGATHGTGLTGASGSHATPGSGTAQNTAGPHNSDMLNKIDPRVDSDLSGGKTYGGNQTHA